jgi:hypothetical protein
MSAIKLACRKIFVSLIAFLKKFFSSLSSHANLLVALATFFLALLTFRHIAVTKRMAEETKRLADISIEQFKIKSYPTFLITRTSPTYVNGLYKDEIKILNKGEISSFETSVLIFFVIRTQKQQPTLSFTSEWTHVYRDEYTKNIAVLDYSKKIPANSGTSIGINTSVPKFMIDNLQYQIIIIRHKVPYDTSFSYEAYAFAWEIKKQDDDSEQSSFHWETLPDSMRDMLLEKLFNSEIIAPNKEKKILEFFTDYPNAQQLKFYKKKPPD